MKAHLGQTVRARRKASRHATGFALVEALFVIGILFLISLFSLRSIAQLGKTSREEATVASKFESKAAAEWTCEHLPTGERAWFRKI